MSIRLNVTNIYHDWFKHDNDGDTNANSAQIEAILTGRAPLPPRAIIQYDTVNDDQQTDPGPMTVSWARGTDQPDFFTPGQDTEGKTAKMKPGRFNRTRGWDGLLVTYPPSERSSALMTITAKNGATASVSFPWVAKEGETNG